jgi:hypothetical protein
LRLCRDTNIGEVGEQVDLVKPLVNREDPCMVIINNAVALVMTTAMELENFCYFTSENVPLCATCFSTFPTPDAASSLHYCVAFLSFALVSLR